MRKNVLFFILVLVLSLVTAPYFGSVYNLFSPQESSAFWGLDQSENISFAGFFVAFVFFQTLFFGFLGIKANKKWFIIPMIPVALLWLGADIAHIYIPIILSLIGFSLAWLIRKIFVRHHNLPMVVNK